MNKRSSLHTDISSNFMTDDQLASTLNVGKNTARKISEAAGARVVIASRIVRNDWNKIQQYLDKECRH